MGRDFESGFTCGCGEYHKYSVYVYSHYDIELIFTCPKCGNKYSIISGIATSIEAKP
jgi:hypothetical protein